MAYLLEREGSAGFVPCPIGEGGTSIETLQRGYLYGPLDIADVAESTIHPSRSGRAVEELVRCPSNEQAARMSTPAFGLKRFDFTTPANFAADVARAETAGWNYAFVPDSQLRRHDTYVLLTFAAQATERIRLGPLLANPITRHPTVTAGSIATVDEVSDGRAVLGLGIGDTAVRLAGLKLARVAILEAARTTIRALLVGADIEVGAERPARLPHPRPVPVWIAAAGPRMLRAAGRVVDGVFIRANATRRCCATLSPRSTPRRTKRGALRRQCGLGSCCIPPSRMPPSVRWRSASRWPPGSTSTRRTCSRQRDCAGTDRMYTSL